MDQKYPKMAITDLNSKTFSGTLNLTSTLFTEELLEAAVDVAHASNTVTLDYSVGNIFYMGTAFSAAATINITNAPTVEGSIFSVNLITSNPSNATFRPNILNVNGSAVTIRWAGATAPSATTTSSRFDIWTFTLLYRSSSFVSFVGSQLNYG